MSVSIWLDEKMQMAVRTDWASYGGGSLGLFVEEGMTEFFNLKTASNADPLIQTAANMEPFIESVNEHPLGGSQTVFQPDLINLDEQRQRRADESKTNNCFQFDPKVPHLGSFHVSSSIWSLKLPDSTGPAWIQPRVDVNRPEWAVIKHWSCKHAKIEASLYFYGEGSGGLIFRRSSDGKTFLTVCHCKIDH